MEKHFHLIRGFPGSGKSTLAHSIGGTGTVLSIDNYLVDPLPDGEDIFTSLNMWRASALLKHDLEELLREGSPLVVVDTVCACLWEVKSYWLMAEREGYAVTVSTPETPWARNPQVCRAKTQHTVEEPSMRLLATTWEMPPTRERVMESASPEERLEQAKWLLCGVDDITDQSAINERLRYIFDNYTTECGELTRLGFVGPSARNARRSFRLQQQRLGHFPPAIEPIREAVPLDRIVSSIEERLGRRPETPGR